MALRPGERSLNVISLCTGGGGLDFGLELACPHARAVCYVEREAFTCARLVTAIEAGLMARAPLWTDVSSFNGRPWRGGVDCVIGGIPCQPHSVAGKRLGDEDERDLWSPARRIIVQSGAWGAVIENVEGMLSAPKGKIPGARRVIRDLERLGFVVEIGLFTASEVGAPHRRARVFILAIHEERYRQSRLADASGAGWEGRKRRGPFDGRHGPEAPRSTAELRGALLGDAAGAGPHAAALDGTDRANEIGGPRHAQSQRRSGALADADDNEPKVQARDEVIDRKRSQDRRRKLITSGAGASGRNNNGPNASGDERYEISGNAASAGVLLADALGRGHAGRADEPERGSLERDAAQRTERGFVDGHLFPPGPSDFEGWRRALAAAPHCAPALSDADAAANAGLEAIAGLGDAFDPEKAQPFIRRVADGLAPLLDGSRVDRLRMLGNGVVPLEGAYAIRTLGARLAARGVAGADEFVLREAA